jgi:hypothetical protein
VKIKNFLLLEKSKEGKLEAISGWLSKKEAIQEAKERAQNYSTIVFVVGWFWTVSKENKVIITR